MEAIKMFPGEIIALKVTAMGKIAGKAVMVVDNPEALWLTVQTALNLDDIGLVTIERVTEITGPYQKVDLK